MKGFPMNVKKKFLLCILVLSGCSISSQVPSTKNNAQSPHVVLPENLPGISGLFALYPKTAQPLKQLAQILLRGESTLSAGERELIASYVSYLNNCIFCCNCHSAAADYLLDDDTIFQAVKENIVTASISNKLKALLMIAGNVQQSGTSVTLEDIARARAHGATDQEIHDTVLIAAAFCMYNRYVDGLAAWTPTDPALYDQIGEQLAQHGYVKA